LMLSKCAAFSLLINVKMMKRNKIRYIFIFAFCCVCSMLKLELTEKRAHFDTCFVSLQ
jgi:hypothetical protein